MRISRCHWLHTPLARQHVIAFFYYFFDSNDLLSSLYLIDTSVITYNQAVIQIKIVNAERMNKLLIDKPDLNPQGNNYSVIRPVQIIYISFQLAKNLGSAWRLCSLMHVNCGDISPKVADIQSL